MCIRDRVIEARVEDYLARYDVPAREQTDVRWAQTCMTREDTVEQLGAQLSPVHIGLFPGRDIVTSKIVLHP